MGNYWEKAFDALPDLVSLHTKDHRMIKVNKSLRQLLDKSPGEIIGKCYEELFDRNSPCENCPLEKTVKDLKSHTKIHSSEGVHWLVTTGPIIENDELVGVIHSVKDITELRETQQKLANQIELQKKTESRLNSIIESLPDITFIIDEDGKYCEVYARDGEHNLILPVNKLRSTYFEDTIPEDKLEIIFDCLKRTLDTNEPQIFNYCLPINGKTVYFQGRTSPIPELIDGKRAIIWVAIDIDNQVRLQKELSSSEEKYRNIVNRMTDGLIVMSADLDFHHINPAICRMSGYTEEEIRTMDITQLFTEESLVKVKQNVDAVENNRQAVTNYEAQCYRKDGSIMDVIIRGGPYNGSGNRIILFTDITEIKNKERELTDLRKTKRRIRLGEILVNDGVITFEQLSKALSDRHRKLGEILLDSGILTKDDLNNALSKQQKMNSENQ